MAIDRAGVETPLLEQPGSWATPRVSPDGRLLAIREIVSRVANLQLLDERAGLMLGSLARLQAVDPGWRLHGCSTRPAVLIVAGRASLHDRHGSRRGRSPARVHGRWGRASGLERARVNRRGQGTVLAGGPTADEPLTVGTSHASVGDRCFSMEGTASGGRVLMEGTITGWRANLRGGPAEGRPHPDVVGAFLTTEDRSSGGIL